MTQTLRESIMLAAMEGDLQRLLSLGRDGLGRPLLLGGETLNVLGWSGPPAMPRDAAWEDFIAAGFAPDFQWSDDLFETNSLDLSHGFSVCQVPLPDNNGSDWLVDIEMTGSQPVHLILSGRGHPELPPPDGELLSLVCLAVRTCLNNRAGLEPHQRFSAEHLLLQLIRNKNFDEPLLRFRAQSVQMESEGYFALLMLDLNGYHPQRSSIATVRGQLAAILGNDSVIDGEVLTFLISHNTGTQEEKKQLWTKVEPILRDNGLFGVFSRPFYRLGDFHFHYTRTLDTLKLRFCVKPGTYLVAADDLSIYSLISILRHHASSTIDSSNPVIDVLQQSDRERSTSYLETLEAYLRHSQKPTPTCEDLHIHRNTLDYRLKRIEALTGLDWGDGDLMFRLYFALCTMRYERLVHNMGG